MTVDYSDFYILHAEDEEADARAMQYALKQIDFNGHYERVSTGQALKERLSADAQQRFPDLLFLDIGLPGMSGLELLANIRSQTHSKNLPVLMLSGSSSQRDYHESIRIGANGYIQKTSDLTLFVSIVGNFTQGWCQLNSQEFF